MPDASFSYFNNSPTTGDQIVLGDTSLKIRVEYDLTEYGDECKFGGGKSLREGMGQVRRFKHDTLGEWFTCSQHS